MAPPTPPFEELANHASNAVAISVQCETHQIYASFPSDSFPQNPQGETYSFDAPTFYAKPFLSSNASHDIERKATFGSVVPIGRFILSPGISLEDLVPQNIPGSTSDESNSTECIQAHVRTISQFQEQLEIVFSRRVGFAGGGCGTSKNRAKKSQVAPVNQTAPQANTSQIKPDEKTNSPPITQNQTQIANPSAKAIPNSAEHPSTQSNNLSASRPQPPQFRDSALPLQTSPSDMKTMADLAHTLDKLEPSHEHYELLLRRALRCLFVANCELQLSEDVVDELKQLCDVHNPDIFNALIDTLLSKLSNADSHSTGIWSAILHAFQNADISSISSGTQQGVLIAIFQTATSIITDESTETDSILEICGNILFYLVTLGTSNIPLKKLDAIQKQMQVAWRIPESNGKNSTDSETEASFYLRCRREFFMQGLYHMTSDIGIFRSVLSQIGPVSLGVRPIPNLSSNTQKIGSLDVLFHGLLKSHGHSTRRRIWYLSLYCIRLYLQVQPSMVLDFIEKVLQNNVPPVLAYHISQSIWKRFEQSKKSSEKQSLWELLEKLSTQKAFQNKNLQSFVHSIQSLMTKQETEPPHETKSAIFVRSGAQIQTIEQMIADMAAHTIVSPQFRLPLKNYVPLDVHSPETQKVYDAEDFLSSSLQDAQNRSLLIVGSRGSGKTMLAKALVRRLWSLYPTSKAIPLYIRLSSVPNQANVMEFALGECSKNGDLSFSFLFSKTQIVSFKKESHRFIALIDQCDEPHHNTVLENLENHFGGWNVQLVLFSRSEYWTLNEKIKASLAKLTDEIPEDVSCFQISELTREKRLEFFSNFVECKIRKQKMLEGKHGWKSVEEYEYNLNQLQHLHSLSFCPEFLYVFVEHYPEIYAKTSSPQPNQNDASVRLQSLVKVYVDTILNKEVECYLHSGFKVDSSIDLISCSEKLCADIAKQMQSTSDSTLRLPLTLENRNADTDRISQTLLGTDPASIWLRRLSFISESSGDTFEFTDSTLFHYFADGYSSIKLDAMAHVQPSISYIMSSKYGHEKCITRSWNKQLRETDSNLKAIEKQRHHLSRLISKASNDLDYRQQLMSIIHDSKRAQSSSNYAAEAVTILNLAGVSFSGQDLKGIRIQGANLSDGLFEGSDLGEADLRDCYMGCIGMTDANFCGAKMDGVDFGLLPPLYTQQSHRILVLRVYSYVSENDRLISVSADGVISIWDLSDYSMAYEMRTGVAAASASVSFGGLSLPKQPDDEEKHVIIVTMGSEEGGISIWRDHERQALLSMDVHSGAVRAVGIIDLIPQSPVIVSGGDDGLIQVIDPISMKIKGTLKGHLGAVLALTFWVSAEKHMLVASGGSDRTIRVWDVTTLCEICVFRGHYDEIRSLDCIIDYNTNTILIFSGSGDGAVRTWNLHNQKDECVFYGHSKDVVCVKVIANTQGELVVLSASEDGTVRAWEWPSAKCKDVYHIHEDGVSILSCPIAMENGSYFACAGASGEVQFHSLSNRPQYSTHRGHVGPVNCVLFIVRYDTDGQMDLMASCGDDATVRIWDLNNGSLLWMHKDQRKPLSMCVVEFSEETEKCLAVSYNDGMVRLFRLRDFAITTEKHDHTDEVKAVCSERTWDGHTLVATGGLDGMFYVWNAEDGHILQRIDVANNSNILCMSFVKGEQDALWLATGTQDETVRLWDIYSGEEVRIFIGHSDVILDVIGLRGSDGEYLVASASQDNTIRVWDIYTGVIYFICETHSHDVTKLSWFRFHPEAVFLVSCSKDRTVRWWDMVSGHEVQRIGPFQSELRSVSQAFAKNGNVWMAVGGSDGVISVLDSGLDRIRGSVPALYVDPQTEIGYPVPGLRMDIPTPQLVHQIGGKRRFRSLLAKIDSSTSLSSDTQRLLYRSGAVSKDIVESQNPTMTGLCAEMKSASWCRPEQAKYLGQILASKGDLTEAVEWFVAADDVGGLLRVAAQHQYAPATTHFYDMAKKQRLAFIAIYAWACCNGCGFGSSNPYEASRAMLNYARDGNMAALEILTLTLSREPQSRAEGESKFISDSKTKLEAEIMGLFHELCVPGHPLGVLWYHAGSVLNWRGWDPDLEDASHGLGILVERGSRIAFRLVEQLAKRGLASAQYMLGFCYRNGLHVEQSMELCVRWYQAAAKQQHPAALCGLGLRFFKGEGVAKDVAKALDLFVNAADRGDQEARQIVLEEEAVFRKDLARDSQRLEKLRKFMARF